MDDRRLAGAVTTLLLNGELLRGVGFTVPQLAGSLGGDVRGAGRAIAVHMTEGLARPLCSGWFSITAPRPLDGGGPTWIRAGQLIDRWLEIGLLDRDLVLSGHLLRTLIAVGPAALDRPWRSAAAGARSATATRGTCVRRRSRAATA